LETCKSGSEGGGWKRTETYLASRLPYLKKGSQVFVEGRLIADPATGGPRLWTRQDGNPAASFEIHADLVQFLGGKNGDANGQAEQPTDAPAESEIPF
jgi:single-strand DNA-binding protein